jgi:hypothetical protein
MLVAFTAFMPPIFVIVPMVIAVMVALARRDDTA